jgi:hypothetical protein
VPWQIGGQLGVHARAGVDASGWLWEIIREDDARRVLVEISGTAGGSDPATLPKDTARAIESEGESEVQKALVLDDPPRIIQCGTAGCRPVSA